MTISGSFRCVKCRRESFAAHGPLRYGYEFAHLSPIEGQHICNFRNT